MWQDGGAVSEPQWKKDKRKLAFSWSPARGFGKGSEDEWLSGVGVPRH